MKFDELYSLLTEEIKYAESGKSPIPSGARAYTNDELKEYLKFDLGFSDSIAKIVYDFIYKYSYDEADFKVVCWFLDHPLLSKKIGYYIITPQEGGEIGIIDQFMYDLWKYALETNRNEWRTIFPGSEDMYDWSEGRFRSGAKDNLYVWEYDPMEEYTTDKETKDTWRDIITNL